MHVAFPRYSRGKSGAYGGVSPSGADFPAPAHWELISSPSVALCAAWPYPLAGLVVLSESVLLVRRLGFELPVHVARASWATALCGGTATSPVRAFR